MNENNTDPTRRPSASSMPTSTKTDAPVTEAGAADPPKLESDLGDNQTQTPQESLPSEGTLDTNDSDRPLGGKVPGEGANTAAKALRPDSSKGPGPIVAEQTQESALPQEAHETSPPAATPSGAVRPPSSKPALSKPGKAEPPFTTAPRRPAGLTKQPNQPATVARPSLAPKTPEPEPPTEPRKPPEWKVLEPEDQTDPVPHEVFEEEVRSDRWTILAASVRGKLHAHKALWRDDAFAYGWTDDWTILVVSDGAGSARISRIGARIACDEAVKVMKELLAGYRFVTASGETPGQSDLWRLRTFLSEGARKAQFGILREAQKRGCPPRDLNATFLMAVHCPWQGRDFVGAIQVGDGAVGLLLEGDVCTVLGAADHGDYSAETRFLTTPGIEYEFDQRVRFCCKKGVRCLAIMCDGVSDDFFPEDKRLIELFTGNPIQDLKARSGEPVYGVLKAVLKKPEKGKALLDWLRYEKKQSSDDRTLLLMHGSDLT